MEEGIFADECECFFTDLYEDYKHLPIEEIDVETYCPYVVEKESVVQEYVFSMQAAYLPVFLCENQDMLMDGSHRITAARRLGWTKIKAHVCKKRRQ